MNSNPDQIIEIKLVKIDGFSECINELGCFVFYNS